MYKIESLCRKLEPGDYQVDFDIKEQYHNYLIHTSERVYHGVSIPPRLCQNNDSELGTPLMSFTIVPFGWGTADYLTLIMFTRALELVKGNPKNVQNPFDWHEVVLNLPSAIKYHPGLPLVRLVRKDNKRAAEIIYFFDDGRVHGPACGFFHAAIHRDCT